MAKKKPINERCPFNVECDRKKCEFQFHESECNYYIGNSRPGYTIPDQETEESSIWDDAAETTDLAVGFIYIPIEELYPHPDNPRKDLGDLTELADSIKVKGVLQNLTVIPGHRLTKEEWIETAKKEGVSKSDALGTYEATFVPDGYTILIGHRRMAAAKLAGLTELPCAITDMPPSEQVATMLLENMQRNDLTVYEQAKGFQLMLDFGDTIETVAEKSGFSQTTVRRRIKLLELDEEKFKRSEGRNVSLFEYMELDKIKDIDLKNKVLDSIGTANFNNELQKAIEKEKTKEYIDKVEGIVSKFATKIESGSGYSYTDGYSNWSQSRDVKIPEDAETVEYYYTRDDTSVYIYKKRYEEADEQKKQEQAEREEKRKAKIAELSDITKRMYELRKKFIDGVTTTTIKKNFTEILSFWMYRQACDSSFLDEEDVWKVIGIAEEDYENEDYELAYETVFSLVKKSPEIMFWKMVCLSENDRENKGYYQKWYGKHVENITLTEWYEFLGKLGYEMSDEEKALRDGTHELFITEESE